MIKTTWLGTQRIDLETCGSTNDEAARLARAGASHGTVVIAEAQTAGRGRDGRVWQSPPGGLYLSAIIRPPLPLAMVPPMTLAVGIGVCDAVRACGVGGVLKWPNDVLVDCDAAAVGHEGSAFPSLDWRKLAGVLVEAQSQGGRVDAVIVGIGLNVRAGQTEGPVAAISTSLEREAGEPIDREIVIARVLGHVERWLDRYVAVGLPAIIPAWQERMAQGLIARARIARQESAGMGARQESAGMVDGELVIGEVTGLDAEGSLLLRDASGTVRRVRSGDVEVIRPAASGSGPVVETGVPQSAC